jgi:uncharacterized membrane protein YcaP (DUF421 family)
MDQLFKIDWGKMLLPDTSFLEIFLRGSIVYIAIFFLLRIVLKRQSGAVGITDLLVVVLIADAAQNAMADDYHSIPDGILLVATLIFWSYFLDWLGYRFPQVQRFIHPPPLPLVRNGQLLRRNLRKELITEGELMTQLREQGIADLKTVRSAYMEGDGYISVIKHEDSSPNGKRERRVS